MDISLEYRIIYQRYELNIKYNRDNIDILRLLLKSYWIAVSTEWFKVDYNCDRLSGHVTQALRHQILILSTVTYGIRNIPGSFNPKISSYKFAHL